MFNFGTPEQNATIALDLASMSGPGLPVGPLDELTEEELRSAIVYCRMAIEQSLASNQAPEVVDLITSYLEEAVSLYVQHDRDYARDVLDHKRQFPVKTRGHWEKVVRKALSES